MASQLPVASEGTPTRTGATRSTTVNTCTALVVLPQVSVTVHVRVITPQPSITVLVSLNRTVSVGSQLSVAVTVGGAGMASQFTVASDGTPTRTGATKSTTVNT